MPIYDRSYRRWDGELRRRAARWAPIAAAGIRNGIRSRRGIFWTLAFYLFLLASSIPFLSLFLLNYFYHFPPESLALEPLLEFLDYLSQFKVVQYPGYHRMMDVTCIHMIYVVLFGSALVARDRAAMSLPLYLSRPMHLRDYVVGKFAVVAFFLCCVSLFPCLILWALDVFATDEPGYLLDSLDTLAAILVQSVSLVTVYSLTILAASSLVRRPMVAAIAWVGTFVVLRVLLTILEVTLGIDNIGAIFPASAAQSIAYVMFDIEALRESLPNAPQLLSDFGIGPHATVGWSVLSLAAWSLGALWVVFRSVGKVDVTSQG